MPTSRLTAERQVKRRLRTRSKGSGTRCQIVLRRPLHPGKPRGLRVRPRPLQTPAAPPAATPRRSAPRAAASCRNAPSPKTVTSSWPQAVGRIVFSSLRVCPYLGGGWLLRAALGHLPCLPAPVTPGRVSFCREHPCLTLSESPRSAVSRGRRELGRWVLLIPLRVPGARGMNGRASGIARARE